MQPPRKKDLAAAEIISKEFNKKIGNCFLYKSNADISSEGFGVDRQRQVRKFWDHDERFALFANQIVDRY